MKITIEFDTENAAFDDFVVETRHVLEKAWQKIANGGNPGDIDPLHDSNGNRVGEVRRS